IRVGAARQLGRSAVSAALSVVSAPPGPLTTTSSGSIARRLRKPAGAALGAGARRTASTTGSPGARCVTSGRSAATVAPAGSSAAAAGEVPPGSPAAAGEVPPGSPAAAGEVPPGSPAAAGEVPPGSPAAADASPGPEASRPGAGGSGWPDRLRDEQADAAAASATRTEARGTSARTRRRSMSLYTPAVAPGLAGKAVSARGPGPAAP